MADKPMMTLFVPGLLWPEPDDEQAFQGLMCPVLERFWGRSPAPACLAQTDVPETALLHLLRPTQSRMTVADLRLLGESHTSADSEPIGSLLCADPVHLRFHHEQILLADPGAFSLTETESSQLMEDLNRDFADLGCFSAPHPQRWYLRLRPTWGDFCPKTESLSAVAGKRLVGQALHTERDAQQQLIRRWQNEIQMWLHAHPVNAQRLASGQLPVNGVWLWGTGVSPSAPLLGQGVERMVGPDTAPFLRGLALSSATPWQAWPEQMSEALQPGTLAVFDEAYQPWLYEDSEAWQQAVNRFEDQIFRPLWASGQAFQLVVPSAFGTRLWRRQDYQAWQFWRGPVSMQALSTALAAQGRP